MKQEMDRYAVLTSWIRELSSPKLTDADNAEEYRVILHRNFKRIAELARINEQLLEQNIYPALQEDRPLRDEEVACLQEFNEALGNASLLENFDAPMLYVVAKRLLKDAEEKHDEVNIIRSLDELMTACYALTEITDRLYPHDNSFYVYREEGLQAANRLLALLDKEQFAALPDEECKHIVLVMSRYAVAIYQHPTDVVDTDFVKEAFALLERAREIEADPFYHEQAPDYDWKYHHLRTLEYFSNMTERNNELRLNREQLEKVYAYTEELYQLHLSDPAYYEQYTAEPLLHLNHYRNSFLVEKLTLEEYQSALLSLMT